MESYGKFNYCDLQKTAVSSFYDGRRKGKIHLDIDEKYLNAAFINTAVIVKGSPVIISPDNGRIFFIDELFVEWTKNIEDLGLEDPDKLLAYYGLSTMKLYKILRLNKDSKVIKFAKPRIRNYLTHLLALEGKKHITSMGNKHRRLINFINLSLVYLN